MAAKPKKREKEEKERGTGRGKTTVETFAGDEAAKWGNRAQADKRGVRVCVCECVANGTRVGGGGGISQQKSKGRLSTGASLRPIKFIARSGCLQNCF